MSKKKKVPLVSLITIRDRSCLSDFLFFLSLPRRKSWRRGSSQLPGTNITLHLMLSQLGPEDRLNPVNKIQLKKVSLFSL